MSNRIQVNVLEPGEAVKPTDETETGETEQSLAVPDTGANSQEGLSASGMEIFGASAIVIVLAIVAMIVRRNRAKSEEKGVSKKALLMGLMALGIFSGAVSFATLKLSEGELGSASAKVAQPETSEDGSLTVKATDIDINVEVDKEAVFAMAESKVSVSGETRFGYNLSVYASDSVLAKEDGPEVIKTVSNEEPGKAALSDNTWGFTNEKPEDQTSKLWYGMPNSKAGALEVKTTRQATSDDETSLYYGVYVTPELPHGVYTGPTINYIAVANVIPAEVYFDYDGYDEFFFDEAKTETTNTVGYARVCEGYPISEYTGEAECEWTNVEGEYKEPVREEGQELLSWYVYNDDIDFGEFEPTEEGVLRFLRSIPAGEDFSGMRFWAEPEIEHSFEVTYDANGGAFVKECSSSGEGGIRATAIQPCTPESLTTKTVEYNTNGAHFAGPLGYDYVLDGKEFVGWSEDPAATEIDYYDGDELPARSMTLYAVWEDESQGGDIEKSF